jgi:hypothetical protein
MGWDARAWEIQAPDTGAMLTVRAARPDEPLGKARVLTLTGDGWPSLEEADRAGNRYRDALMFTLARSCVGADFYSVIPGGAAASRPYEDDNGFLVYETGQEPPVYRPVTRANAFVSHGPEIIGKVFRQAVGVVVDSPPLTDKERLAFELYNAAFFETSIHARFLTQTAALEALLPRPDRSAAALEHIAMLAEQTRQSTTLTAAEKASLCATMEQQLRYESVGRMARALIRERMGREVTSFGGKTPVDFFTHCYTVRSNLIHANLPRPTPSDVLAISMLMESFVSQLLCAALWEQVQ